MLDLPKLIIVNLLYLKHTKVVDVNVFLSFMLCCVMMCYTVQTKQAMEVMNMDLKDERQAKLELQATVSQLELEVKKLKADLHVSPFQR